MSSRKKHPTRSNSELLNELQDVCVRWNQDLPASDIVATLIEFMFAHAMIGLGGKKSAEMFFQLGKKALDLGDSKIPPEPPSPLAVH